MSTRADPLARYNMVTATLKSMSEMDLVATLDRSACGQAGIGGATRTITVAGTSVFVKLVRLAEVEREAGSGCTSNFFGLPTSYQYSVGEGSTGFNAWREVAAHEIARDWVLSGECANFPLLYHWRELPRRVGGEEVEDVAGIDRAVRFWSGSPAIEARLRALSGSSTVVLRSDDCTTLPARRCRATPLQADRRP